jgi:hydroxymethylbilane synthase
MITDWLRVKMTSFLKITIATRESRLAMWQAQHVQTRLQALGHSVSLLPMTTLGDQILDRTLSKVGGKGLFIKELETALADGRADIAVHSLKDVPMELPDGFELACVMEREDPRDALVSPLNAALVPPANAASVSPRYASLDELPHGAVVGTSSLRRMTLLHALRPDLKIEPLRGNLDTRLKKLDDGGYAAIVLAAAGLKRLGLGHRITQFFDPQQMLPAAGQGALGVEICSGRDDLLAALAPLAHAPTWTAVSAEREVSRAMGGSCSMPLAAFAVWQDAQLHLRTAFGDADGVLPLSCAQGDAVVSTAAQARQLGAVVALQLKAAVQATAQAAA